MKFAVKFVLALCVLCGIALAQSFTDPRDGKTYRTVVIAGKTWMAENLNFQSNGSWCYDNVASNCNRYGRLYDWATVMGLPASCNTGSCAGRVQSRHRGICPAGWRVPKSDDWGALAYMAGGWEVAGTQLKAGSGWNYDANGADGFGFSALPGGGRWEGIFNYIGDTGWWWTASEVDASQAETREMYYEYESVDEKWGTKTDGHSVRCIRD